MAAQHKKGFTLIELLISIAIVSLVSGIVIFGLRSSQSSTRDQRRIADLKLMQSGLETQFSDCGSYTSTNMFLSTLKGGSRYGQPLVGGYRTPPCYEENEYIKEMPTDPSYPDRKYYYDSEGRHVPTCSASNLAACPWVVMDTNCPRAMAINPATGSIYRCSLSDCTHRDPTDVCQFRQYYILCAALETPPQPPADPALIAVCNSRSNNCGNRPCNYVITSPTTPVP